MMWFIAAGAAIILGLVMLIAPKFATSLIMKRGQAPRGDVPIQSAPGLTRVRLIGLAAVVIGAILTPIAFANAGKVTEAGAYCVDNELDKKLEAAALERWPDGESSAVGERDQREELDEFFEDFADEHDSRYHEKERATLEERGDYAFELDKYSVVVVKVKLSRMDAPELTISCANVVNG